MKTIILLIAAIALLACGASEPISPQGLCDYWEFECEWTMPEDDECAEWTREYPQYCLDAWRECGCDCEGTPDGCLQ